MVLRAVLAIWLLFHNYPIHARPVHKINELLRVSQLAHQGNFLCGGISTTVWWQICRQALAVAKSSLISSHPTKASKSAPQLVANGSRAGPVFATLDRSRIA